MHASSDLSFPLEQFQHLPNPYYPHDALRDSLVRTNIVNLDLASPPPPTRTNPRSHPLTPPDTPGHRRSTTNAHQGCLEYENYGAKTEDVQDVQGGFDLKRTALDAFLNVGLRVNKNSETTRYLVVGGVPPLASTAMLSQVFSRMGALKGMFVRYQNKGVVVLSWHDLRDAKKACGIITNNRLFNMDEVLSVAFVKPFNLIKSTGESLFVNPREGNITITAELPAKEESQPQDHRQQEQQDQQQKQHPISLHTALALFGELSSFSVREGVGSTTYFASYYDAREAANAAKSLHGRSILGMHIRVVEGFHRDYQDSRDSQGYQENTEDPQQQQQLSPVTNRTKAPPSPVTPENRLFHQSITETPHHSHSCPSFRHAQSGTPESEGSDTSGTPHVHVQSPAPAALDATNSTSSFTSGSTFISSSSSNAAGANSPIAQLPPSANLVVRQGHSRNANGTGMGKGPPKQNVSKQSAPDANVPLYSTPAPTAPAHRLPTISTGGIGGGGPGFMRPESGSPPAPGMPPPQMIHRTIPPRLSLPWLHVHGPMHGSVQPNGSGLMHRHPHQAQGPPSLGPGAYIHGLDNNLTPQSVHRGPYAYHPPPPAVPPAHLSPGPASARGYVCPITTNNNLNTNANTGSTGTGTTNTSASTSPITSHNSHSVSRSHSRQAHAHASPHTYTLSASTTSTSTGPSTLDSGPSTPLHVYGRSPALSSKGSFDLGHTTTHHHHHHYQLDHGLMNLQPLPGGPDGVGAVESRTGSGAGMEGRKDEAPGPGGKGVEMNGPIMPAMQSRPTGELYTAGAGGAGGAYHGHAAPERNGVDIGKIEAGLDTRTTVMLKNVPNKMSDADLRKYISDVVPNSFDFVYLRFDFNSSANVGYAFVNFVEVADLLLFAKARLGVKWNMFCSEKVLQMSYANFQGKEALVEKFKNSCVMEMQDEWVPKIFHSSGPKKGQREPFPAATNPSRARRSQDQRERGLLRGSGLFVGGRGYLGFKHGR